MIAAEELDRRFKYHPPDETKKAAHQSVRDAVRAVTESLTPLLPEGREKSLFVTKLEEAMFWANAAIARDNVS